VAEPSRPDASAELSSDQADATIASRRYLVLLVVVSVIGVIVSLAAWCFLELIHQLQQELYTHLPHAVGYSNGPPKWWSLPILAIGALLTALAIRFLPGKGGHVPAKGLAAGGPSSPSILPGVILAGLATIGFGLVLGPEAPLIALGGGLAAFLIGLSRRETPPQALMVVTAAGAFAAVSFIFSSPLIAAILMIEVTGLGGPKLRVILIPGLLAAGIGSLVSLGMGQFTGLSTSAYALGPLPLSATHPPTVGEFGWTIALAIAIAAVTSVVIRGGLLTYRLVSGRRLLVLLPVIGLIIGGLAIGFSQITGKSVNEVLFSGQDQLPGLVGQAGTWSLAALTWLLVFKGLAYLLSLGSYRGGPTFPALFLGAATGIMASHLPGFPIQVGVAVGMGAAVVAVLRLPLSAVVIATVLTSHAVPNLEPLIIVGVVVSYVVTLALSRRRAPREGDEAEGTATAVAART
jgi:H+/Cl- antiporter ClcA